MRGKIISREGNFFVEALLEGEEGDSVETRLIKVSILDRDKVYEGDTVTFDVISFHSVDEDQIARIRKVKL